jgi:subtilisin family serine protease
MKNSTFISYLFAVLLSCPPLVSYPWYFSAHGIDIAHDNNILGDGVKIAVVDTPAHLNHPLLASPSIRERYCYANEKENKTLTTHGTKVTSIIGAKAHDAYPDFVGIAPNATIETFGVPPKECGLTILDEVLLKIKEFKPDIINVSSNVLRLSDARVMQSFEEMVKENPSLVIVVAAGNDGSTFGRPDTPCREESKLELGAQTEIEQLADHNLKENFALVGNLARASSIKYGDLLLLPNDDSAREREDLNFSGHQYSLARQIRATDAVDIIRDYLKSAGPNEDYFSGFEAYHTDLLTNKIKRSSEDEILFSAGRYNHAGEIPSDSTIRSEVTIDSIAGSYQLDQQRITREIQSKMVTRDLKRTLLVKALKTQICRKEMTQEISKINFVQNAQWKAMNDLFIDGLPKNNSQLLMLARDYIPIKFNQNAVLNPSSARAGALEDIFIGAFGTDIPAASIEFAKTDTNKENPIYTLTNNTGTSFAAPIVTGAIALVVQACKIAAKPALSEIYKDADKSNSFWVFGQGKLNIANIIKRCVQH